MQSRLHAVTKTALHCISSHQGIVILRRHLNNINRSHPKYRGAYPKHSNLKDPNMVINAFRSQRPEGSTCLDGVLRIAFDEHFRKGCQTTILVITDGEPDDKKAGTFQIV